MNLEQWSTKSAPPVYFKADDSLPLLCGKFPGVV